MVSLIETESARRDTGDESPQSWGRGDDNTEILFKAQQKSALRSSTCEITSETYPAHISTGTRSPWVSSVTTIRDRRLVRRILTSRVSTFYFNEDRLCDRACSGTYAPVSKAYRVQELQITVLTRCQVLRPPQSPL